MTTHSPYVLNSLYLASQAGITYSKSIGRKDVTDAINAIVPIESVIMPGDLKVYQCDSEGTVSLLDDCEGVPSDNNCLNNPLGKANDIYNDLLDIEDQLKG